MCKNHSNPLDFSDMEDEFLSELNSAAAAKEVPVEVAAAMGMAKSQSTTLYEEDCPKCRGRGKFISYTGRIVGDCFSCHGKGKRAYRTAPAVREHNRKTAAERRERKAQQAEELFKSHDEELYTFLADNQWSEFYQKMLAAGIKWGKLTERQEAAVRKGMAKMAAKAEARAEMEANLPDLSGLFDAFAKAKESGLKAPKLVVGNLTISMAKDNSRNPGWIYVKDQGAYRGKISPEGKPQISDPALVEELVDVAGNLLERAIEHARDTGICSFCARELTDDRSINAGYGPTCAKNYGLPWGGK